MSGRSRPISLEAALIVRRAQAQRARLDAAAAARARRPGFSIAALLGLKPRDGAANDAEPEQRRKAA